MAADTISFDYNSGRYRLAALMMAGFGILFGLFFGIATLTGGSAVAAFFVAMGAIIFAQSFRRGSILVIGPEGLTYMPFSRKPVPWSDISEVMLVSYEGRAVKFPGKAFFYRQPGSDTVNFGVKDPKTYPGGPGRWVSRLAARMYGLPPISIQVPYVKGATLEAIAGAIRKHWDGRVEEKLFSYPRQGNPY